jgi:S1-C subfamily serine protease
VSITLAREQLLGVSIAADVLGIGVRIATVEPDGPAARGGVREGDVIVELDGRPVLTTEEVVLAVKRVNRGLPQQTILTLQRQGQRFIVTLKSQTATKSEVPIRSTGSETASLQIPLAEETATTVQG